MSGSDFNKKLIKSNALFNGKKIKLSGIQDSDNFVIDATLQGFSATNKFTLSATLPEYMTVGSYFRISAGGGANLGLLFKVLSTNGNDIFVDDSEVGVSSVSDFGPNTGTVDFRIWVTIDDTSIAKGSDDDNTIFNLGNLLPTVFDDGSGIALNFADHYHIAEHIPYDNTSSGLSAIEVQTAIDEIWSVATTAMNYQGTFAPSGGAYPSDPEKGDVYRASDVGTVDSQYYTIGDFAAYNGTAWDHWEGATTWVEIDKTVSDIADITTKSHTSLTEIGSNTHTAIDAFLNFFNGTFLETFNALVTSDGATVTLSVEQAGGGDLIMNFSDGQTILDTTPAATISLTPGSVASPQENFTYILKTNKVLENSTTEWPNTEHIKVAYTFCKTAAVIQTRGALINQNWNNHVQGTNNIGHQAHTSEHDRRGGAQYFSGINGAGADGYTTSTAGVVRVAWGAGIIYQAHEHITAALDTAVSDKIDIVNAHATDGGSYFETDNLYDITVDTTGSTLNNRFFNIVLWGVANKTGEFSPAMANIPGGVYKKLTDAQQDVLGYDTLTIPRQFSRESSTAFLIARITFKKSGGTWVFQSLVDLRGQPVHSVSGSATASLVNFDDNLLTIFNFDDPTKVIAFDVGNVTTGTTRTYIAPDDDGTLVLLSSEDSILAGQVFS